MDGHVSLVALHGEAIFLVAPKCPTSTHGHVLFASALWLIMYAIRDPSGSHVPLWRMGKWNFGILRSRFVFSASGLHTEMQTSTSRKLPDAQQWTASGFDMVYEFK